jgi:hypothetical protein
VTDWDSTYSYVIAATGWTWEYIDEFLTLPRLNALQKHWAKYPPVDVTAALHFPLKTNTGDRPRRKIDNVWQAANVVNDAEFATLASQHPGVPVKHFKLPR